MGSHGTDLSRQAGCSGSLITLNHTMIIKPLALSAILLALV